MSLFQPSTLTFGDAKTQIAKLASKQSTTEFKTRAGDSIQRAVKYWNKYNWRWLCTQAADIAVSASATSYDLPYDFKDVYTLRRADAGNSGAVVGLPRRVYDRVVYDQTSDQRLISYDLFTQGDLGKISVHPGAGDCTTLELRYYRRMWVPCAVTCSVSSQGANATEITPVTLGGFAGITNGSPMTNLGSIANYSLSSTYPTAVVVSPNSITTLGALNSSPSPASATGVQFGSDLWTLDIPEDYENGIMSWAAHHFLSQLGAPESRLSYFIRLAEDEFQEARAANERFEDQDIAFEYGAPTLYPHI